MKARTPLALVVLVVVALGGCTSSTVPARPPEVTGTVSADASGDEPFLSGASDGYYEGMPLRLDDAVVVDAGDSPAGAPGDGEQVEVWVGEACNESFPVQCDVVAVRVLD